MERNEYSKRNYFTQFKRHTGKEDIFCLIYGLGGLIGAFLRYFSKFNLIKVPMILFSWFLIIFLFSILDVGIDEILPTSSRIRRTIGRFTEFIELLISISSFLYLFLNFRILKQSPEKIT